MEQFAESLRVVPSVSMLVGAAVQLIPRSVKDRFKRRYSVPDMEWSLRNLARLGFEPVRTFDVGAYEGQWTEQCKTIFPRAQIAMIEVQPQKRAALERVATRYRGDVHSTITLVGASEQTDVVYYENETVTSVLAEAELTAARRMVAPEMQTLDGVARKLAWTSVDFIKIDVQGYELEVLKGAESLLTRCQVLLIEVNLIPINVGAALASETINFLHERGFRVYDICSLIRRPLDDALWQTDLLFVREGHPLIGNTTWGN